MSNLILIVMDTKKPKECVIIKVFASKDSTVPVFERIVYSCSLYDLNYAELVSSLRSLFGEPSVVTFKFDLV